MLDFWLPDGAVELVVYAHSIDFGAKGHGNLVELASLQRQVADALGVLVGRLVMIIKSAHVYETELSYIEGVLAGAAAGRSNRQSEAEAESQLRYGRTSACTDASVSREARALVSDGRH
jgi:hypothetical protein